jgi:twitching motility two-component system response regulator PilH
MEANKKIKILIVDDDPPTRNMYSEVFTNADFDVMEASDGVEGLDIATKNNPDVIFTGISMPRMDGFSLVEQLKKNTQTCNIPVVISSHLGRESDRQRANSLGARDFIIRDVTPPREVVERIKTILTCAGDYLVEINPYNFDAQKLSKDEGISGNFQCPECGGKIVLHLKNTNLKEKKYRVIFVCSHCGWETG